MESILSLFVFHDTYVVSFLVIGITVVVVMLLLFNQKSPEAIVKTELEGGSDKIEGALRRVLGEKQWQVASASGSGGSPEDSQKVAALEKEVLDKDRTIANLNKQLTHASSGDAGAGGDNSDLMARIHELEERLHEYEIIEDDIADLSLYKNENEKLKEELQRLKAIAGGAAMSEPEPEPAQEEPLQTPVESPSLIVSEPEPEMDTQAQDLVAEFEKVVNNQANFEDDSEGSSTIRVKGEANTGKVVVAGLKVGGGAIDADLKKELASHPKLRGVSPDSKEEAEVFISELKSLKKGS